MYRSLLVALMATMLVLDIRPTYGLQEGTPPSREQKDQRKKARGKQRQRQDTAPKVGDLAPDFSLKSLDGESTTELSAFRNNKPVVLIFGSYT
jgi:hypothetical protein